MDQNLLYFFKSAKMFQIVEKFGAKKTIFKCKCKGHKSILKV